MSESLILNVAIFVFAMMMVGLALTIREFRVGQPHREASASTDGLNHKAE